MSRSRKSLDEQLAALGRAVTASKARAREVRDQHHASKVEVERLTESRVEAFAAGDERLADKLLAERQAAEATVREFEERVAGAERAAQRAEAEQAQFATHNCDALFTERGPAADAAVGAVKDAVGQLVAAKQAWDGIAAATAVLLRFAGRSTADIPSFPAQIGDLAKDARRAGAVDVPRPVPGVPRSAARVVAVDHPDPAVSGPARAEIHADRAGS